MQSRNVSFELNQRTIGYGLAVLAALWLFNFSPFIILIVAACYLLGCWPFNRVIRSDMTEKPKNDHAAETV